MITMTKKLDDCLKEFAIIYGLAYKKYSSVIPNTQNKNTEFIFMNAMSRPEIYNGEIPEFLSGEISVVRCIRRGDSLDKAGSSTRHMTSFDMLGLSCIAKKKNAIYLTYTLIRSLLDSKYGIQAKVHPKDVCSKNILTEFKITYTEDSTC